MIPGKSTKAAENLTAKLVMFDLDGTLAESKSPLDPEMAALLCALLEKIKVAVISGASFGQFQSQFLRFLPCDDSHLENLLMFPTVGAGFYRYEGGSWIAVYEKKLTPEEVTLVEDSLRKAIEETSNEISKSIPAKPGEKIYGEQIENRGSQVTFSALGQQAPVAEKASWDPDHAKRQAIVAALAPLLPDFEIEIGGMTSIDITKKGIDKEYGINAAADYLALSKNEVLYVGDSIFEGGNDYGAVKAGVPTHAVKNVPDTKNFIREFLADSSGYPAEGK